MFRTIVSLTALTFLTACVQSSSYKDTNQPPLQTDFLTVRVEPEMVDCVGLVPMKCLVVDGEYFYDDIDGFEFEAGNSYILEIERVQIYTDETVPADASLYSYKLINILEKQPQAE